MSSGAEASVQRDEATQLEGFFYPVAQSRLITRKKPLERTIYGRRIALFRDEGGRAHALDARCPHHGANLADGVVIDGCLACPYHGWRFAADGRCVHIPSQPARPIPPRATTRAFEVVEHQGIVWVHAGGRPAVRPPPSFGIADDPTFRGFAIEETVPGPADWWVDNFMDISHVPFVHRSTFGGHRPTVTAHPVERWADEMGYSARVVVRYEYGLVTRLIHGSASVFTEDAYFEVTVPATVHVTIDMGKGRRQGLALFSTPEDATRTHVIMMVWRNYLRWAPFGDALGRRFTRAVLMEDKVIVERGVTAMRSPDLVSVAADGPALEFARLMRLWSERERRSGLRVVGEV